MNARPKYSQAELERRFLIDASYTIESAAPRFLIEDTYLDDGRLRLRSVTDERSANATYKLCKKYPPIDELETPITNLYLSKLEFELLAKLPGQRISKRRYHVEWKGAVFGVDVFSGELAGLRLGELSGSDRQRLVANDLPDWAGQEVTMDVFFQGGNLCHTSGAELREKLAMMQT